MKKFLKLLILMLVFIAGLFIIKVSTYAWYTSDLIIYYQYEDGTTAHERYSKVFSAVEDYYVVSPEIKGYTPDKPVIEGTFTESIAYWVTYTINSYDLTINYLDEDGNQLFDSYTNTYTYLSEYSITSPIKDGYDANILVASGKIEEDTTINVIYSLSEYTLHINYKYENGTIASDPYEAKIKKNQDYEINSPKILGYAPDKDKVSGKMEEDLTVDVIYHQLFINLTIHYVDEAGNQLIEPSTYTFEYFERYEIETPEIKGYYADEDNITGVLNDNDVDVTIVYHKKISTIIFERVLIILESVASTDSIIVRVFYEIYRRWFSPR